MKDVLAAARCAGTVVDVIDTGSAPDAKPHVCQWPRDTAPLETSPAWTAQQWLCHYTRSHPEPWPGQAPSDYYASLHTMDPLSAHSAIDALRNMLRSGIIRSSARMVRGDTPVVSFTGLPPGDVGKLHAYAPHLARWNFEPFAFCIGRRKAALLGAEKTLYVPASSPPPPSPAESWKYQWIGRVDTSAEHEWRIPGDVDLSALDASDACLLVPSPSLADALRPDSRFPVLPLGPG